MIQRKQTLFLLLAVILGVVTMSTSIATVTQGGLTLHRVYCMMTIDAQGAASFQVWPLFLVLLLASSISLINIFLFRQRMVQAKICLVSIFLYVAFYLGLAIFSKTLAPDALNFHLSFSAALPAVCAILTMMARKGIIPDEKLVRAADRIR